MFPGFTQADPEQGFDLETTKLILQTLAQFHAIPMVMKQKKPMEFRRYVKEKCVEVIKSDIISNGLRKHVNDAFWEKLYENNGCLNYITSLKAGLRNHQPLFVVNPKEPFATIIHNNFWVKNIFVQFYRDKPLIVSIIDFQEHIYGSPASDLLNFLLTSTEYTVLDLHFYELLKYYHDNLLNNLKQYDDIDLEPFGWDKFLQEIKQAAAPALLKAIFFLLEVVHGGKTLDSIPFEAKQRIWMMLQQIGGNGWL